MLSTNKVNQCGSRKPNIRLILTTYVLDFLPRDWDGRSNVRSTDIFLCSPRRSQLLDLIWRHCIISKKAPFGDSIRVFFTGNKENICGRDAHIWLWGRKNASAGTTHLCVSRSAIEKGINIFFCNNVKRFMEGKREKRRFVYVIWHITWNTIAMMDGCLCKRMVGNQYLILSTYFILSLYII